MSATKDILLGKIRGGEPMTMRQQMKLASLLSYPAILAQFSSVIMQYIDTAMVGHLGAAAGASIGLVSTCLWLFGGFGMALCSGFSVQVAQYIGARMNSSARNVLRQGLLTCFIFSVALAIVGALISGRLPYWLGGTPEIAAGASKYFLINALFFPMMQLDWMSATMLQCSGNMKIPSILSITMCVLDVIFNYLFIYVLGMGVPGAALGTGLAEAVTALMMFYFLAIRSPELRLTSEKGSFTPEKEVLTKATKISAPMFLENIVMRGAHIASTIIVAPLGTIAIAANAFAITAESLCYMPGYGIGDAATTLVGQSIGANRKKLANRFAWITTGGGMIIMTALSVLMFIFAPQMMGLLSPDPEVVALGAKVLRIEAFAETMYAASIVANGACIGAGDTLIPSIMNFTSMWIVRIIPAAILTPKIGLTGFWIAMCVELNFRGIIFLLRLRGKKWMDKGIVTRGSEEGSSGLLEGRAD